MAIFGRLAARKINTRPSNSTSPTVRNRRKRPRLASSNISSRVVTLIVMVTAIPYAEVSAAELRKVSTKAITATAIRTLIAGTKICPDAVAEVCTTRNRGRRPSRPACWTALNIPEITACDAITVAAVARIVVGRVAQLGTRA